mmetsp:Transcript_71637/g.198300  ORF Transcript_71637/g.198300 Transcript_71637/m.198300 type:complete len:396 (-) Transcript_71637:2734-3921(-)
MPGHQCEIGSGFLGAAGRHGAFQPLERFLVLAPELVHQREFEQDGRVAFIRLQRSPQALVGGIEIASDRVDAGQTQLGFLLVGVELESLFIARATAGIVARLRLGEGLHHQYGGAVRVGARQRVGDGQRLGQLSIAQIDGHQGQPGIGLFGICLVGPRELVFGHAGLARLQQRQAERGAVLGRVLGLQRVLHQLGRARVVALAHVRRRQHQQRLAVAGPGLDIAVEQLDRAADIGFGQGHLGQQLDQRTARLLARGQLQEGLGLLQLAEAVVGQAVQHQQLGPVADVLDGHGVEQVRDLLQRRPGRGLVSGPFRQHRAKIGAARIVGQQALQRVDLGQRIGITVQVDQQSRARQMRLAVLGIHLDRLLIAGECRCDLTAGVQDRSPLVDRLGVVG